MGRFQTVRLRDGGIGLELRGAGPPLLFLHGISANRRVWDPVADLLEDRFTLLLPDLLSRGTSEPRPDLRYRLADELRRVRELVAGLPAAAGIPAAPRLVVGHSQGAALALALAAADEGVEGLVLINPVTPWTPRPIVLRPLRATPLRHGAAALLRPFRRPFCRWILARVLGPGRRPTAAEVEAYAGPYRDPRRARALLAVLADWEPAELAAHLPRRPLRARVLAGEADRRIGVGGPAALARHLGTPCLSVPRAGHVLPVEAPAVVARTVEELFQETEDARRERSAV